MCAPAPVIIAGASLLMQAGSAVAEQRAAAERAKANREEAARANIVAQSDISARQREEGARAARQLRDIGLQATGVKGRVRASAAAAGVQGSTVEMLLGDVEGSEGRARADIIDTHTATIEQLQRRRQGATAAAASRANAVPGPSGAATALRIGGAVSRFLYTYDQINAAEDAASDALGES